MTKEYISSVEAAKILGISRQYLLRLAKVGEIPCVREEPNSPFKVKPLYKFRRADIEALLKKDRRAKVA